MQRETSRRLPPGGRKSPVRAFRAIGGEFFCVAQVAALRQAAPRATRAARAAFGTAAA